MAVLTLSQIRQEFSHISAVTAGDDVSSAMVEAIFHRIIAELFRRDSAANIQSTFAELDPDLEEWKVVLLEHVYDQLLGPLLTQKMGSLSNQGDMVLRLWSAVKSVSDWLTEVWWNITEGGQTAVDQGNFFRAEHQVAAEFTRPEWSEPVTVLGQLHALVRIPAQSCWYVIQWQATEVSAEVTLGQAALYHFLLGQNSKTQADAKLAIVSFLPEFTERAFETARLDVLQENLLEIAGRLAGVMRPKSVTIEPVVAKGVEVSDVYEIVEDTEIAIDPLAIAELDVTNEELDVANEKDAVEDEVLEIVDFVELDEPPAALTTEVEEVEEAANAVEIEAVAQAEVFTIDESAVVVEPQNHAELEPAAEILDVSEVAEVTESIDPVVVEEVAETAVVSDDIQDAAEVVPDFTTVAELSSDEQVQTEQIQTEQVVAMQPAAEFVELAKASASEFGPSESKRVIDDKIKIIEPADDWVALATEQLLATLQQGGAACHEAKEPTVGPVYARFFVYPQRRITTKKVLSQGEFLEHNLGLNAQPIMAAVGGTIRIDLPRPDYQSIPFSSLVPLLPEFDEALGCSKVPVGVDLDGKLAWCDLAANESAHAMVVGAAGSGKSQWIRAAITSLVLTNTPETLQFLFLDPSQELFHFMKDSPFIRPAVTEPTLPNPVSSSLASVIAEMKARYLSFVASKSNSLAEHVEATGVPMKRIICICDEYADLLAGCGKADRVKIERQITHLAAEGRPFGIHLILATRQPKSTVLTNAIRSYLSAKIVFKVSDARESRLAMEREGAERLFGEGDLLYTCIGNAFRYQGAWLPADEEHLAINASQKFESSEHLAEPILN